MPSVGSETLPATLLKTDTSLLSRDKREDTATARVTHIISKVTTSPGTVKKCNLTRPVIVIVIEYNWKVAT